NKLIPYSMLLLGGLILLIALFRLIRGKMKIEAGRSHIKVPRFTPFQRLVHWSVAILFVTLAFTGLILTFGRDGLIPIIGNEAFSWIAIIAKRIHDFAGPVFSIMIVVMLFTFMKGNFAKLVDVKWLVKAGGLFGGGHVSAGRYNAGEKAWYWFAMLAGAVVVVSGLILDFPIFGQERDFLTLTHVFHGVGAVIMIAASFGHIYMGTIGVEGAFEAMQTGYCDSNWAKEHHDIWYDEMAEEGKIGKTFEELSDQEKMGSAHSGTSKSNLTT
ncbi:MAG: Formate dehydrogenase -O, gamma subunit (EC, partial [uncultured Thiotrichaceae bacterium]